MLVYQLLYKSLDLNYIEKQIQRLENNPTTLKICVRQVVAVNVSNMNTNKYTIVNDYQIFVSFIDKSVMEDSQTLVPPDTHKLGHS